jgi:hypothetical protein
MRLNEARSAYEHIHRQMVALQEELDWKVYALFGLCEEVRTADEHLGDGLHPENRPMERLLSQRMASGEPSIYYEVHAYRGTGKRTGLESKAMESVIQQRLKIIETVAEVRLIEHPDYKRRWQVEPWEKQQNTALRNWLLTRLETSRYWPSPNSTEPTLQSTARLADRASADDEFLQVAALYRGRPDFNVAALVDELVEGESVPFLPILRYKPAGLRKREVWERTWDLQRQQDAGNDVGEIPVPPKYATADFLKTDIWRLRGKLDVPKERWISYPHCSTDSDPSLVIAWAGWNHLEQATALVSYYDARKREGWTAERLAPLLAGLDQLIPWIHQWHPEVDPEYGETAGQSFQHMLESDAHELGMTIDDIRKWTPPEKIKKAKAAPRKKKAEAEDEE